MTTDDLKTLLAGATAGPWHKDGPMWNQIVWKDNENRVCFMAHSNGLDDARDDATARLIAAAPDLAAEVIRLREGLVCEAQRKLSDLVEWLNADEDNGALLMASLTAEQIQQFRALLGETL